MPTVYRLIEERHREHGQMMTHTYESKTGMYNSQNSHRSGTQIWLVYSNPTVILLKFWHHFQNLTKSSKHILTNSSISNSYY